MFREIDNDDMSSRDGWNKSRGKLMGKELTKEKVDGDY